ncbi:hypothetical protein M427DRAFT_54543 [Gonapodya prolifera JEL478]|uniref:Uncharacterized protein n=1 Tax=Gonapodya prolifera (strain JEL478) TaxID=1344416 RepID=A0A139ALJ2_GONPJ|nr:hypothetical protein M427DRAFT_54543 [Gonapodya prolifera JEL478]|eukprot:KXS17620.1 hypothetical protein M427DRAFT_54543 [Gonapodya prolifera JEL478]
MHENDRDRPRPLDELYAREKERNRERKGGERSRRTKDSYRRSRSRSLPPKPREPRGGHDRTSAAPQPLDPAIVEARRKENERLRDERERARRERVAERGSAEAMSVAEHREGDDLMETEEILPNGNGLQDDHDQRASSVGRDEEDAYGGITWDQDV